MRQTLAPRKHMQHAKEHGREKEFFSQYYRKIDIDGKLSCAT